MTLKGFNKFLNTKKFKWFSRIIVVFSFGSIILLNLGNILKGKGLEDVITDRGIKTNSISILVLFGIILLVFLYVFVASKKHRIEANKITKKERKRT